MIDKNSSEPLYHQIQYIIEEQILSGKLKPGDRTLSEPEIAAKYEVSRLTARKALENLVNKNLLYRQPGKGTFVAEHGMAYGFSTMLSFSRSLKARGFKVETHILDQAIIPSSAEIAGKLRLEPGSDVVIIRRLRFVDGIAAGIHSSFFDARVYRSLLQVNLSEESVLEAAERIGATRMAYSIDTLCAMPIGPADGQLLNLPVGSPVLELAGTVFNDNNLPCRYTKGIYRGDMFRMEVKNTRTQATSLQVTWPDRASG